MTKYNILLFDADNTILDFDKAEEEALRRSFGECNLFFSTEVLQVYRRNNVRQWQLFEKGEIADVNEVLSSRFIETFKELGVSADYKQVGDLYELYLHEGSYVIYNAEKVLQKLQALNCKLYLVTNGVLSIQNSRLRASGMGKYFIERFISEEVGYPKPKKEFFNRCFDNIDEFDRGKAIIIGDSLTSDIQGGINAGIATCWYNPKHKANNTDIEPTYQIDDLQKLLEIIA